MTRFAYLPKYGMIVTANDDGSVGLNAGVVAEKVPEAYGPTLALAGELVDVLQELVARCDGAEGVRADGSNIQTIRAHAVLRLAGAE